jgi:hypothetical protein
MIDQEKRDHLTKQAILCEKTIKELESPAASDLFDPSMLPDMIANEKAHGNAGGGEPMTETQTVKRPAFPDLYPISTRDLIQRLVWVTDIINRSDGRMFAPDGTFLGQYAAEKVRLRAELDRRTKAKAALNPKPRQYRAPSATSSYSGKHVYEIVDLQSGTVAHFTSRSRWDAEFEALNAAEPVDPVRGRQRVRYLRRKLPNPRVGAP